MDTWQHNFKTILWAPLLMTGAAGWGLDAQGVQKGIDTVRGTKTAVPKAGTILVFKLRKA